MIEKTKWKSNQINRKNKFIYPFKQTTAESCFHIAEKRKLLRQKYVMNLTWLQHFEQKTDGKL